MSKLEAPEGWFLRAASHQHRDTTNGIGGSDFRPTGHGCGDFLVSFAKYPEGNYCMMGRGRTLEQAWENAALMTVACDAQESKS